MTSHSVLVILAIVVWIAAQFGLAAAALYDLRRGLRPGSGNPVAWALVILCLPIAGPLLYFGQDRTRSQPGRRRARAVISPRRSSGRGPGSDGDWPWDDDPPPGRGNA